jgi:ribonuclease VapC
MIAVIDASVVIAFLQQEPGGEKFLDAIREGSAMSATNVAEVVKRMFVNGASDAQIAQQIKRLEPLTVPFDSSLLTAFSQVMKYWQKANLSLADCICLATAKHLALPVLTADRSWKDLESDIGVEVILIR